MKDEGLLNVLSGHIPLSSMREDYMREMPVDLVHKGQSYVSNLHYHDFFHSEYRKHLDKLYAKRND